MSKKKEQLETNPEIVFREEDDGAFLFDPDTGRLCYLNELGAVMWKHIGRQLSKKAIIEMVAAEYPDVPGTRISSDCRQFIQDLQAFGFIKTADGS